MEFLTARRSVAAARVLALLVLLAGGGVGHAQRDRDEETIKGKVKAFTEAPKGQTDGLGRFVYVSRPPGLDKQAELVLDGEPYVPGPGPGLLVVPVMPGPHSVELRTLPQPPVFRSWQMW